MKIIEPKVELWQQGDDSKAHVARCARVCYGRETGKMTASDYTYLFGYLNPYYRSAYNIPKRRK